MTNRSYQYYFDDFVGTYIGHAEHLAKAAQALEIPTFGLASSMLLGQSVELSLKAWIVSKELSRGRGIVIAQAKVRKQNVRHDLFRLWSLAFEDGLVTELVTTDCFQLLAETHGSPYELYPQPATMYEVLESAPDHVLGLSAAVASGLNRKKREVQ